MRYAGTIEQADTINKVFMDSGACIVVKEAPDTGLTTKGFDVYFDDRAKQAIQDVLYSKKYLDGVEGLASLYWLPSTRVDITWDYRDNRSRIDVKPAGLAPLCAHYPTVAEVIEKMRFIPADRQSRRLAMKGYY